MNILVKGKSVHFDDRYLHVEIEGGRLISTPMDWNMELQEATVKEVSNYVFICQKTGIEWPGLDCHLSIESMLNMQVQERAA